MVRCSEWGMWVRCNSMNEKEKKTRRIGEESLLFYILSQNGKRADFQFQIHRQEKSDTPTSVPGCVVCSDLSPRSCFACSVDSLRGGKITLSVEKSGEKSRYVCNILMWRNVIITIITVITLFSPTSSSITIALLTAGQLTATLPPRPPDRVSAQAPNAEGPLPKQAKPRRNKHPSSLFLFPLYNGNVGTILCPLTR